MKLIIAVVLILLPSLADKPKPDVVLLCFNAETSTGQLVGRGGLNGTTESFQASHYRVNGQGKWQQDAKFFCVPEEQK